MKKINFRSLFLAPFAVILLLFAVSPGHVASTTMPDITRASENSVQCQVACPALPATKKEEVNEINEADPDPTPVLPYYASFIGMMAIVSILLGNYLRVLLLKWQPPDLIRLYDRYLI